MAPHLLLLTISPVQSFIVQARKTHDLYAGSQILVALAKAALHKVVAEYSATPISPSNKDAESIPNRFLVRLDADVKGLAKIGEALEKAVIAEFQNMANEALRNAKIDIFFSEKEWEQSEPLSDKFKEAFKQQINNHLDIFWLFEEIKEDNYPTAYKNIERNLAMMKGLRPFQQFNYEGQYGERGRKCSLDGERNALFFGEGTNTKYFGENSKWNPLAMELILDDAIADIKVRENEGLSAVSFVKRFWKKGGFPSTAKIALMEDIKQLSLSNESKDWQAKTIIDCYKGYFGGEKFFDEQLFFEDNLTEKYFKDNGYKDIIPKLPQIKDHHKKIKSKLTTKYYAIITFDGDNMGKWLSGAFLKDLSKLENFHKTLSKLLAEYAQKVDIKEPEGAKVYSGGDDFLGFINIHHLFSVLKRLRKSFDELVNTPLKREFKDTLDESQNLTFSAGVSIAHYKTPLGMVLGKTSNMQDKAKEYNNYSKNALGLSLMKHSGECHESVVFWGGNLAILDDLQTVYEQSKDNFSSKWKYSFQKEFSLFTKEDNQGKDTGKIDLNYRPLIRAELNRLIERACKLTNKNEKKQAISLLKNTLENTLSDTDYHFQDFSELMNITTSLASKID